MNGHALIKKWYRWLDTVNRQVTHLKHLQNVFREVQNIIAANSKLHHPSAFYDLVNECYGTTIAVGIRKLDDHDSRSISFLNLLEDIRRNSQILSRRRYVGLYIRMENSEDMKEIANSYFDDLVGPGRNHISKSQILKDLRLLKRSTRRIRKYVNKQVAHINRVRLRKLPTYKDLDNALNEIENLAMRYEMILRARSHPGGLTPVIQYNWMKIFEVAWAP